MRNNSLWAGLHRYKRNLLFPFFALIFALPNLIGCTQVLPIEEGKQEITVLLRTGITPIALILQNRIVCEI